MATVMDRIDDVLASGRFRSARDWALAAGLSANYFSAFRARFATGEVTTLRGDAAVRLAQAAGVAVPWLLGEDAPPSSSTPTSTVAHYAGVDEVLERYEWPQEMTPEQAQAVVGQLRKEHLAAKEPLPQAFWMSRLTRLCREAMGRVKSVPERPTAEIDLDAESPHKASRCR